MNGVAGKDMVLLAFLISKIDGIEEAAMTCVDSMANNLTHSKVVLDASGLVMRSPFFKRKKQKSIRVDPSGLWTIEIRPLLSSFQSTASLMVDREVT